MNLMKSCLHLWSSHGYIAQWLERLTADQQVPGSNPGVPFLQSGNGQQIPETLELAAFLVQHKMLCTCTPKARRCAELSHPCFKHDGVEPLERCSSALHHAKKEHSTASLCTGASIAQWQSVSLVNWRSWVQSPVEATLQLGPRASSILAWLSLVEHEISSLNPKIRFVRQPNVSITLTREAHGMCLCCRLLKVESNTGTMRNDRTFGHTFRTSRTQSENTKKEQLLKEFHGV